MIMKKFVIPLVLVLIPLGMAWGTTLLVPSQYATIQAGINASSNGDTVLVAAGTYTGASNKNLDFGGRAIVVMSEVGPEYCIIDCESSGRGAYFHSGETNNAVLHGFTITNGSSSNSGGINCTNASPTIERCIIKSNSSLGSYGAGIYMSNASPRVIHCSIVQNTGWQGGAMYVLNSSPVINSCIVYGNVATG
jgi:hypothetical protein